VAWCGVAWLGLAWHAPLARLGGSLRRRREVVGGGEGAPSRQLLSFKPVPTMDAFERRAERGREGRSGSRRAPTLSMSPGGF